MTAEHRSPYPTPAAFRRALTDRLRAIAAPHGPWPLSDLQRQFAYDRLLTRLYSLDDAWILKGATAMLARRIAVRHIIDVDIYRVAQREQANATYELPSTSMPETGSVLRSGWPDESPMVPPAYDSRSSRGSGRALGPGFTSTSWLKAYK